MSEPLVPNFGNPADALLRWAWETNVEGVPIVGSPHDVQHEGETLSNSLTTIERTAIARGALQLASMPSKIDVGGDYLVDAINPQQDWFPFAAMFGKSATPVAFETGAYLHRLSALESNVAFPSTFTMYAWRQDGMAQRFAECRFSSLEVTFEQKKLIGAKFGLVSMAGDYWSSPISLTGAVLPQLRGISVLNFFPHTSTDNVYIKVTAVTSTTYTIKVKIGDATAYNLTQVVPIADWIPLRNESGRRIGNHMSPVEGYFAAGMAVNDEAKILRRRDEWVSSPVDPSLAGREVSGRVLLDGAELEINSGKLVITRKAEAIYGYGRRGPRRTRTRGAQTAKLTFGREYNNLEFRRRLELGSSMAVRVEVGSDVPLGATGEYDYSFAFVMPNCVPFGKTPTAEKRDTSNETLEATAFPSSDPDYPADVTVEIRNDIPDLLAA